MSDRELKVKTGWNLDNSYSRLPKIFYKRINPTPVRSPYMIAFNDDLAEMLGLNAEELNRVEGAEALAGNSALEGSVPIAQAYAGHQFAHFTMLGDGRAVLLGEQVTPDNKRFDIQLKGSGRTPFSRGGDGRAAIGPMLREYIVSEAMHSLKIPTTRSLAVVGTGEHVYRETVLKGAVLTRVASSHIRVGTFQYAANWGNAEDLRALADYTINRHFSYIKNDKDKYLLLLDEIITRQAFLISEWQLVGFIHGVMNTDNMAVSGETIDYGPCAFMDTYNPDTVFSSIDTYGRYAYKNQPQIARWNLLRLAEALLPILHDDEETAVKMAQDAVSEFDTLFNKNYYEGMRRKIGLFNDEHNDLTLIDRLLDLMYRYEADYTHTFNALTENKLEDIVLHGNSEFIDWYNMWQARLLKQEKTKEETKQLMRNSNPSIIPRNYLVEHALKEAESNENYSVMKKLLNALSNPYSDNNEYAEYKKLPPAAACPYKTFCGT